MLCEAMCMTGNNLLPSVRAKLISQIISITLLKPGEQGYGKKDRIVEIIPTLMRSDAKPKLNVWFRV